MCKENYIVGKILSQNDKSDSFNAKSVSIKTPNILVER